MSWLSDEYFEYIRSDEWKSKRDEYMSSVCWECEICGERAVQVHHICYENFGDEGDEELQALCYRCHCDEEDEKGNDMSGDSYGEY